MNALPLIRLATGQPGLRATLPISATEELDEDLFAIRVSDETIDRYGEIIAASGWKLDNYRRNPVVQNCHQYGDITFTIARAIDTYIAKNQLCQVWQFATKANPLAKIARDLYRGGFLRAASVGFVPIRWEDNPKGTATVPVASERVSRSESAWRRRYLEQELIEVSAVSIPANPNALALGLESGAVKAHDLKELVAMLRNIPALQPELTFCNHPAGLPANARASGAETYEAQWLQLLRQILGAAKTN